MTEKELQNMIDNNILNKDGFMSLNESDVNTIRQSGSIVDGCIVSTTPDKLLDSLNNALADMKQGHPNSAIEALLFQVDANEEKLEVNETFKSFVDTLDENISVIWSQANNDNLVGNDVKIYIVAAMNLK